MGQRVEWRLKEIVGELLLGWVLALLGMGFSAKTGLTLSSFLECADLFICSKLAEWMPGQDLVSLLVA